MMQLRISIVGFCCFILLGTCESAIAGTSGEVILNTDKYVAGFFPRSSRGANSPFRKTRHEKRPFKIKKDQNLKDNPEYLRLLSEIRNILKFSTYEAFKGIQNFDVLANWQIGSVIKKNIAESKEPTEYGDLLMINLSLDLNVDRRRLFRMMKFHDAYPDAADISRVLSWRHYIVLMNVDSGLKRIYYQEMAVENAWDADELQRAVEKGMRESAH